MYDQLSIKYDYHSVSSKSYWIELMFSFGKSTIRVVKLVNKFSSNIGLLSLIWLLLGIMKLIYFKPILSAFKLINDFSSDIGMISVIWLALVHKDIIIP